MRKSFLWECVAGLKEGVTSRGPHHTVEVWVVCDEYQVALLTLEKFIIKACDRYNFSRDKYEITTLKRGLEVAIP